MGPSSRPRQAALSLSSWFHGRHQQTYSTTIRWQHCQGAPRSRPELPKSGLTPTEMVLQNPPIHTRTPGPPTADLTITKCLRIGNACGAQIVVCSIKRRGAAAESFTALAKIYDTLYYPVQDHRGEITDPVFMAQEQYGSEAAVYQRLDETGLAGVNAPKYFGSWTFTIPVTGPYAAAASSRAARLVLMEHVDGASLHDLYSRNREAGETDGDAFHLPEVTALEYWRGYSKPWRARRALDWTCATSVPAMSW
jgi:hypothetical protein